MAAPLDAGAPGAAAPVIPSTEASAALSAPVDDRQLDLFAWKPRPRGPLQLNLFGEPEEIE